MAKGQTAVAKNTVEDVEQKLDPAAVEEATKFVKAGIGTFIDVDGKTVNYDILQAGLVGVVGEESANDISWDLHQKTMPTSFTGKIVSTWCSDWKGKVLVAGATVGVLFFCAGIVELVARAMNAPKYAALSRLAQANWTMPQPMLEEAVDGLPD